MKVRKRDGRLEEFDAKKIQNAVSLAYGACGMDRTDANHFLSVIEDVQGMCYGATDPVIDIEQIQDWVEQALMNFQVPRVAKAYVLYRDQRAKERALRSLKPVPDALSDYIVASKYARWQSSLGRREVYGEVIERVKAMHLARFPKNVHVNIHKAMLASLSKLVVGSMRTMQFGGLAAEYENLRTYNCGFTHMNRYIAFDEVFYALLCGCGIGYSVQWHHVQQLPEVKVIDPKHVRHFEIPDTIDGWAQALRHLMTSYFVTGDYVEFSYSKIRPEGSTLHRSGGKAPGHIPLRKLLELVRKFLSSRAHRKLRPIEVHDLCCWIAEAVLSGGIRRSSLLCLFSPDDSEMVYAKAPDNFNPSTGLNSQRMMANNSAHFLRNDVNWIQFKRIAETARAYGCPGFRFTDSLEYGCNPCGEVGLYPVMYGETGFQFCNVSEINGAMCSTPEIFYAACVEAATLGTLQAHYTDFRYLEPITKAITEREALIGVSITGIQDNPGVCLNPEVLQGGADIVRHTNLIVSDAIGVQPAARCTTIKPSGTASLVLNCASGCHPHHAPRYFRRVTANANEPAAQFMKQQNPHMVETKPNGDWCITFPVAAPETAKHFVKTQSAIDFVNEVILLQENWIDPGTQRTQIAPGLTHSVSCTVTVLPTDNWNDVLEHIWENRDRISSMTLMSAINDKAFPYAPREEVVTEADWAKWKDLIENYKHIDWTKFVEQEDSTAHSQVISCEGDACESHV